MAPEDLEDRLDEFLLCIGSAMGKLLNLPVWESGAKYAAAVTGGRL